jgi:hypothetical protein
LPQFVTWDQLRNSTISPLNDVDRIEVVERRIDPRWFEVQFETAPAISVWKNVTLTAGEIVDFISAFWLARLELQDSIHGPLSFRVEAHHLSQSALILGRSKKPGEKHIYWIRDCPYAGTRVELKWIADQ